MGKPPGYRSILLTGRKAEGLHDKETRAKGKQKRARQRRDLCTPPLSSPVRAISSAPAGDFARPCKITQILSRDRAEGIINHDDETKKLSCLVRALPKMDN